MAPLYLDLRGADWISKNQYKMIHSARRFESWELPLALVIGMKEAIKYANTIGVEAIESYNAQLMQKLRTKLSSINDLRLFDQGSRTCNILTFRKEEKSLEEIKSSLDSHQVFYSIAQRQSAVIDFDKKGVDWVIRLSHHYFNTLEEMDRLSEIIRDI